jgi:3-(3-hydroxy-phenyl)propionate hydroxylase
MHEYFPVIIVGAGPSGLVAANLLGQAGIPALLLERNTDLSQQTKADALDEESLRLFQTLGLHKAIQEHALLNLQVHFLSGKSAIAHVTPRAEGRYHAYPFLSTFYQPTLEAILLRGLERFPHIQVRFQHCAERVTQDADGVTLTVCRPDGTSHHLRCTYLLACDGSKSGIRHQMAIPMRQYMSSRRWLVVDTVEDDDPTASVIFFCNPERPAMTILAPAQRRRWEFMLLPDEREENLLQIEMIRRLMQQHRKQLGHTDEPTAHIAHYTMYTFYALIAQTFRQGRIFLLGDAAHLIPPFAGQGMNGGLRDAYNLCWKLAAVLHGQMSPVILNSYEQERLPHLQKMLRFSALIGFVVSTTKRPAAILRDVILRLVSTFPPTRQLLREAAIKPKPRYTDGLLIPARIRSLRSLVGLMLPQPVVEAHTGAMLLDDVLGHDFAILRYCNEPTGAFTALTHSIWYDLPLRRVCVQPATSSNVAISGSDCIVVRDSSDVIGRLLRHQHDVFLLIRPDRFIMGAFRVADIHRFVTILKQKIGKCRAIET